MRLPPFARIRRRGLVASGILTLAFPLQTAWTSIHRLEDCCAPVYAPDGRWLYFVERRVPGLVRGLGFEHSSPPADVCVLSNELRLSRADLGRRKVVASEPIASTTPLVHRHVRGYRGRLFHHTDARIGVSGGGDVQVVAGMAVAGVPR